MLKTRKIGKSNAGHYERGGVYQSAQWELTDYPHIRLAGDGRWGWRAYNSRAELGDWNAVFCTAATKASLLDLLQARAERGELP